MRKPHDCGPVTQLACVAKPDLESLPSVRMGQEQELPPCSDFPGVASCTCFCSCQLILRGCQRFCRTGRCKENAQIVAACCRHNHTHGAGSAVLWDGVEGCRRVCVWCADVGRYTWGSVRGKAPRRHRSCWPSVSRRRCSSSLTMRRRVRVRFSIHTHNVTVSACAF